MLQLGVLLYPLKNYIYFLFRNVKKTAHFWSKEFTNYGKYQGSVERDTGLSAKSGRYQYRCLQYVDQMHRTVPY